MSIIYEPRGKAREYAPLALNLYRGCSHACVYCYGPAATYCSREKFTSLAYVRPRPGILQVLEKDARKLAGDSREVLLSFTSDPYQPMETETQITRGALEILMSHGLTVTILTKGGVWGLLRDLDLLTSNPRNAWSVTLTHDDPAVSLAWELGAALPADRLVSLRLAHAAGLKTWVSFEPVIDPAAVYRLLDVTAPFVDFYKIGKLNYHVKAREIDWPEFRQNVEAHLRRLGKPYLLKRDLLEASST